MFYDLSRKSVGQFVVFATVFGSYGEKVYTQVGRNYMNVEHAAAAAFKLAVEGVRDVTLKNLATKRVAYFDIEQCRAEVAMQKAQEEKTRRKSARGIAARDAAQMRKLQRMATMHGVQ